MFNNFKKSVSDILSLLLGEVTNFSKVHLMVKGVEIEVLIYSKSEWK